MDFAGSDVFLFSGLGHGSARVLVVHSDRDSRLRLTRLLEDDATQSSRPPTAATFRLLADDGRLKSC